MRRAMLAAIILGALVGCQRPTPESTREATQTTHDLDELAARMLALDGRIRTWKELAERRRKVTEVTCSSHNGHMTAMRENKERNKRAARLTRQARLALPAPPAAN